MQHEIDEVIKIVSDELRVPINKIRSSERHGDAPLARHIIGYICCRLLKPKYTVTRVAREIGINHSTIVFGNKKIQGFMDVGDKRVEVINRAIQRFL